MALTTFTLVIDADLVDGRVDTTAKVTLTLQGTTYLIDDNQFRFLNELATAQSVSLPYSVSLPTNVASGVSTTIGYKVTVTNAYGSTVTTSFAARPTGATLHLSTVTVAESVDISANLNDAVVSGLVNGGGALTSAALSDTIAEETGRVYRPENHGAVGDGVTNDLAAFAAMADAVAAAPLVPAKIEITGRHYLSDSVMFDAENLEVYLAEGAHVFTTAATTHGGTLCLIGHRNLFGTPAQADNTPRRGSVTVHGPGKVTGWLSGPNENAIGIVRYARVLVDGPHVNAGHKGVTAQIGTPNVTFRNLSSDYCEHHVVSVEDQGPIATVINVDNIRFGYSGWSAVLASGSWVSVTDVKGDASNAGAAGTAAVHVTTAGTLNYARVFDVDVANTNAAKGVIVSQALDFDIDRVRIGASGGAAVDLFNCVNGGRTGVVVAPSSPTGVQTSGTTPAVKVRRNPDRTVLTAGESTMPRHAISTLATSIPDGQLRLAYFEATRTETITKARFIAGGAVPTSGTITLFRIGVYEVDDATGTLTLVASSVNDTANLATNNAYEKTLTVPFVKVAGKRYAVGILAKFTGALQVAGTASLLGSEAAQTPRLGAAVAGLTDLPSPTQAITSGNNASGVPYLVLVP